MVYACDGHPAGVALVDLGGRLLGVNDTFAAMAGRTRDELRATHLDDLVSGEDRAGWSAATARLGAASPHDRRELRLHSEQGGLWVRADRQLLRSEPGEPVAYLVQIEDLSAIRGTEDALRRNAERTEALAELGRALEEQLPRGDELARLVVSSVSRIMGEAAAVSLISPDGQWLEPVAQSHAGTTPQAALVEAVGGRRLRVGSGLAGRVAATGQPALFAPAGGTGRDYRPHRARFGPSSLVVVPLRARGRVLGVLGISRGPAMPPFDTADLGFVHTLADTAALALDNAALLADAQQSQARLAERERFARSVIDALPDRTAVLDPAGRVMAINQQWVIAATEGEPDVLALEVGEDYLALLDAQSDAGDPGAAALVSGLRAVLTGERDHFQLDKPDPGGTRAWQSTSVVPLGEVERGVVVTHSDITERKGLELQLQHRATHDQLTELPNRLLLADRLTLALHRARRRSTLVAVLFLDLDRFKVVNDSLGHSVGDALLRAASRRLQGAVRPSDTVARFGGDEFVVLVDDCADVGAAQAVAARILEAFAEPAECDGHWLTLSTSIGIALARAGDDPDAVLRDADMAMYRAKERGRGRFEVVDANLHGTARLRLETEQALRHGIDRDEMRVHFQPVVQLADGAVCGAEALVRWQHPSRGLVPPGEFIPVAEETGLVVPLGQLVLARSLEETVALRDGGRPDVGISVNLSPRQLSEPDLVSTVADQLEYYGASPQQLCLEITESAIIGEPANASRQLEALHALGVRIALDDFGTGYSSLTHLQTTPLDVIKIDKSFVHGMGDRASTAVLKAVLQIAADIGLQVIAEGVETEQQRAQLIELGCRQAQGYLLGRPAPASGLRASVLHDPRLHGSVLRPSGLRVG